jgi:hypothetical protein
MRDHSFNVSDQRRARQANVFVADLIILQSGHTIWGIS